MVPPRDAAFALVGILCILTCMQARMATLYNLHCIYRLQNLNIQVALLEYERAIRQRRRQRRYNLYRWRLPRPRGSWFEIHFNPLTPASNCPRPTPNFRALFGIFQSERKKINHMRSNNRHKIRFQDFVYLKFNK